jgi:polyhydroxybutyrate depolymerase
MRRVLHAVAGCTLLTTMTACAPNVLSSNSSRTDGAPIDFGVPISDAGAVDATSIDAASFDASTFDAGAVDGGAFDSGTNDASLPDAGALDAARIDAGPVSTTLGLPDRPAPIIIPDIRPGLAPLLVLLHGYTGDAAGVDAYLNITPQARTRGIYVILPEGLRDSSGYQYWNATSACCGGSPDTDDVSYLRNLVHEAIAHFPIDPTRVYFSGHSNGDFMSLRMACEMSDEIAAIAGVAGADSPAATPCVPSAPVSILHVHGTNDSVVRYEGNGLYSWPGAEEMVDRWAAIDSCTPGRVSSGPPLDLMPGHAGAETDRFHYEGCAAGFDVELYRINGAEHADAFSSTAWGGILDWLTAHHR